MTSVRLVLALALVTGTAVPATGADTSKVKAGTRQIEDGAAKVGQGKVGAGIEETAKGIGTTVVEGAKLTTRVLPRALVGEDGVLQPRAAPVSDTA
jgi:hypothetical protein